ncbi:MAG: hypothetical protein AAB683_01700, partial [Patescibacteria group bacterium]
RKILFFIALLLILTNCNNHEKPKIQKFVWIQNNLNWIWQTEDLKARYYLEYNDSSKMLEFAHSSIIVENKKIVVKNTDYYKTIAPKELDSLIYHFLYNKSYSQSYKDTNRHSVNIYDGDYYCIVYKFENQPEQIITYLPFTITDSLKTFVEQIESYKKLKSFEPQKPFDTEYFLEKYKEIIVAKNPLAQRPLTDSTLMVRYKPPIELDSTKKK